MRGQSGECLCERRFHALTRQHSEVLRSSRLLRRVSCLRGWNDCNVFLDAACSPAFRWGGSGPAAYQLMRAWERAPIYTRARGTTGAGGRVSVLCFTSLSFRLGVLMMQTRR